MENFQFCRVCLMQTDTLMLNSLFENNGEDAFNYERLTNIKVKPSVFPAMICSRCSIDVFQAVKIKETALASSKKIQLMFNTNSSGVLKMTPQANNRSNSVTITKVPVTRVSDSAIQPRNSVHILDDVTLVNPIDSGRRSLPSTPSFGDQSTFSNFALKSKCFNAPKMITSTPKPGHVIKQENAKRILNTGFINLPVANDTKKFATAKPSSEKLSDVQMVMQPNLVVQHKIRPTNSIKSPVEVKSKNVAKRVHWEAEEQKDQTKFRKLIQRNLAKKSKLLKLTITSLSQTSKSTRSISFGTILIPKRNALKIF